MALGSFCDAPVSDLSSLSAHRDKVYALLAGAPMPLMRTLQGADKLWHNKAHAALVKGDLKEFRAYTADQRGSLAIRHWIELLLGKDGLKSKGKISEEMADAAILSLLEEAASSVRDRHSPAHRDRHDFLRGFVAASFCEVESPFLLAELFIALRRSDELSNSVSENWAQLYRGAKWPQEEDRDQVRAYLERHAPSFPSEQLSPLHLRYISQGIVERELCASVGNPQRLTQVLEHFQPFGEEVRSTLMTFFTLGPERKSGGFTKLPAAARRQVIETAEQLLNYLPPAERLRSLSIGVISNPCLLQQLLVHRNFGEFEWALEQLHKHPLGAEAWQLARTQIVVPVLRAFTQRRGFSAADFKRSIKLLGLSPVDLREALVRERYMEKALQKASPALNEIETLLQLGATLNDCLYGGTGPHSSARGFIVAHPQSSGAGASKALEIFITAHRHSAWKVGSPEVKMLQLLESFGAPLGRRPLLPKTSVDAQTLTAVHAACDHLQLSKAVTEGAARPKARM